MKKRIIGILLCVALLVGMLPIISAVQAADPDPQKYDLIYLNLKTGFYNSSNTVGFNGTVNDFGKTYAGTQTFTRETLPVGSLIVLSSGWKYVPDGYLNYPNKNPGTVTRPGWVTAAGTVEVTEDWWGDFTTRAFNIQNTGGTDISTNFDGIRAAVKIYVPKYDLSKYELVDLNLKTGYYNSSAITGFNGTVDTFGKTYAGTQTFNKANLPIGSLIFLTGSWKYVPDGYTNYPNKNESTVTRPGWVTTNAVQQVTEDWWGDFTTRAFNIQSVPAGDISESFDVIKNNFKIYIPKINMENYFEPEYMMQYGYWYPTVTENTSTTPRFNASGTLPESKTRAGTRLFTKETLPNGSIIEIAPGWAYRADGWVDYPASETAASRSPRVDARRAVVDDAWWGDYTSRGFIIMKADDTQTFTIEEACDAFHIYIPVASKPADNDWAADGELSVLTIGNSFCDDSLRWLYDIAKSAGIEKVYTANLFHGGCTIDMHYDYMINNTPAYEFHYSTDASNGWMTSYPNTVMDSALEDHKKNTGKDWDFIIFQTGDSNYGIYGSYGHFDELVAYVHEKCPDSTLGWHMNWAFPSGKYNNDVLKMYRENRARVLDRVTANPYIEVVIPSGTTVQNARSVEGAGNYHRDTLHMDYSMGRYLSGMTWFSVLTGMDPSTVTFTPEGLTGDHIRDIVDKSVRATLAQPFEPTEIDASFVADTTGMTQIDYFAANGFHNSENGVTRFSTGDEYRCYTQLFTRETLPVGSIITLEPGYAYRPEGWENYDEQWSTTYTKPVEIFVPMIEVTEEWWGNYSVRGFNIHKLYNGMEGLSQTITPAEAKAALKIFVPKEAFKDYTIIDIDLKSGYYNSSQINGLHQTTGAGDTTGTKYVATKTFTKSTLPIGSIIKLEPGWKYVPDGYLDYPNKNPGTVVRPGWVTAPGTIEVTEEWWGDFTTRAFNIQNSAGSSLYGNEDSANGGFRIYIPSDNTDPKVEIRSAEFGSGATDGRDLYVKFSENIAIGDGLKVVVDGAITDLSGDDFDSIAVLQDQPDTLCIKLSADAGYDSFMSYLLAQGADALVIFSDDTGYGTPDDAVISSLYKAGDPTCKLHITNADETARVSLKMPEAPHITRVYTYGDDYMYIEFNEQVDLIGEHWYSNLYMCTQSFSSTEPATAWVGSFYNNIINMGTGKTWAVHMKAGTLGDGITCWFNFRDAYPKHWTNFFLQDITPGKTLDGKCDFFVSKSTGLPLEANYDNPTNDTCLSPILSYEPVSNAADAFARIKADTPVELSNGDYIIRNVKTGKLLKADTVRLESGGNNIYYLRNASDQYLNLYYSTGNWVDYQIGVKLRAVEGQDGETCYQILIADDNQIQDLSTSSTGYAYAVLHDDFGEDLATLWTIDAPIETGDINGDRAIDVKDIVRLKKYFAGFDCATIVEDAADCNGDGKISIKDVIRLKRYIATQGAIPFGPLS